MLGVVLLAQEEVPQPKLLRPRLQVRDNRDGGLPPCLAVGQLGVRDAEGRPDLLLSVQQSIST